MLRIIKFVLASALVVFLFTDVSLAKNVVEIKDTLIPHGKTFLIPVYGEIDAPGSSKLKLSFNYNGLILDVKCAQGSGNSAMHEPKPSFASTVAKWDSVNFNVSSSNYDKVFKGILCYLEIEALVGSDSVTTLKPEKVFVDGQLDAGAELKSGVISVGNPTVIQKYPEGVGLCYPNPNTWLAAFDFNVQNDTKVTFKIYNSGGILVQTIPADEDKWKFNIFNSSKQKITDPAAYIYKKGSYKLSIDLSSYPIAAGNIYVLMETASGSYKTNFIYIK